MKAEKCVFTLSEEEEVEERVEVDKRCERGVCRDKSLRANLTAFKTSSICMIEQS